MKVLKNLLFLLVLVFTVSAFAQTNISLNGVGAKIGFVDPENIESTFGFGAVADLGWITPKIALEGEVLYWKKSYDEGAHWEWSYSQLYISALGKYYFEQKKGSKFLPYAGAGIGLVIAKVSSDYSGPSDPYWGGDLNTSESETGIGLHFLGGAKMALSPQIDGFAEARFSTGEGADFFGIFAGFIYQLK